MQTVHDRLARFKEDCRKEGLKATHQRTEIYRELASTEEHPDAETIYRNVRERIPAISFDTVYRTLRTLEEKGVIARVGTPLERSRFDANMIEHHHFVCEQCGAVRDFYSSHFDGLIAPNDVRKLGTPNSLHVEVRGICNACRKKAKRE